MAKNNNEKSFSYLWPRDITDDDFLSEPNIVDIDIFDYNKEKMSIFTFNINIFRQIINLADSLKPVERRILYAMFLLRAKDKLFKSIPIIGEASTWHPHGDGPIYKSMVGMGQPWKKSVPLIDGGDSNFGNDAYPEKYADQRYTNARLSKYAWECFFDDYDKDCVESILNTANDKMEPIYLPSKFPNVLVNGGVGIAVGNCFGVPPYNINDIITVCKRLIENPNHSDIYINPDFPTGCDIIDDGRTLREICETGRGTLRMRSVIEIKEGFYDRRPVWILSVQNIPWMTSLTTIKEKLAELTKKNVLPIKDVQDNHKQIFDKDGNVRMLINLGIIIDKSHDPNVIRDRLYKLTDLEKSLVVIFKVVDNLSVKCQGIRDLVLSWIDERRAYKRRLLNKKISKLKSDISLLDILIELTDKDNIEKTVSIIKNSNLNEIVSALQKYRGMSSFQATKIAEMRLNAFTKDARQKYINECEKMIRELEESMDLIKSEKKIDKIIISELEGLKKYGSPRKSNVIAAETGIIISNTDHTVLITKQGMIKKLLYHKPDVGKLPGFGIFKNMDYPTHRVIANNLDSIMVFDSFGKYSCIPIHSIDNTEPSSVGNPIYNYTKLNGSIVSAFQFVNSDTEEYINKNLDQGVNIITLTKNGYIKKTPITEFTNLKTQRNIRAMKLKDGDELIYSDIILDSSNIIIYTKKGKYIFMYAKDIPIQGKDTMGLLTMKFDDDDECVGVNVIGNSDEFLVIVTEKGNVKKTEIKYLVTDMKRKDTSYLATLDINDNIIYVNGVQEKNKIFVCSRTAYQTIPVEEIPTLSRKAKCQKMIPVPQGNSIISVAIQ